MFGISIPELLLVFVVILVVFGPDKLPEMAAKFGTWTAKFKRTSDSVRREIYNHVYEPAKDFSNRIDPVNTLSKLETDLKAELKATNEDPEE
ncbi:MAG: twin-arginine translocase TatA/TatE family subunit [Bdellovibrionota bacterium]